MRPRWWFRRTRDISALRLAGVVAIASSCLLVAHQPLGATGGGDPLGSACRTTAASFLNPAWVSVGDDLNVRSRLRFECPDSQHGYHLIISVDRAVNVAGGRPLAQALDALVAALEMELNPRVSVGFVTFGGGAGPETICLPSNDAEAVGKCVRRAADQLVADAEPGTSLSAGLREGLKVLLLARGAATQRTGDDPLEEELLVLTGPPVGTGSGSEADCAARAQSTTAQELGVLVGAYCAGATCSDSCISELASPGRYYAQDGFESAIANAERSAWATELRVRSGEVRELLDRHMAVHEDSLDPSSAEYDPVKHLITWPLDAGRQRESTLAYAASALEPGRWPVRLHGYGLFYDTHGQRGYFYLPEEFVTVASRDIVQIYLPVLHRQPLGSDHSYLGERH